MAAMRALALVVVLTAVCVVTSACGEDEGPPATDEEMWSVVECSSSWYGDGPLGQLGLEDDGVARCNAACAVYEDTFSDGRGCNRAVYPNGIETYCNANGFTWRGRLGCCLAGHSIAPVRGAAFALCVE